MVSTPTAELIHCPDDCCQLTKREGRMQAARCEKFVVDLPSDHVGRFTRCYACRNNTEPSKIRMRQIQTQDKKPRRK